MRESVMVVVLTQVNQTQSKPIKLRHELFQINMTG